MRVDVDANHDECVTESPPPLSDEAVKCLEERGAIPTAADDDDGPGRRGARRLRRDNAAACTARRQRRAAAAQPARRGGGAAAGDRGIAESYRGGGGDGDPVELPSEALSHRARRRKGAVRGALVREGVRADLERLQGRVIEKLRVDATTSLRIADFCYARCSTRRALSGAGSAVAGALPAPRRRPRRRTTTRRRRPRTPDPVLGAPRRHTRPEPKRRRRDPTARAGGGDHRPRRSGRRRRGASPATRRRRRRRRSSSASVVGGGEACGRLASGVHRGRLRATGARRRLGGGDGRACQEGAAPWAATARRWRRRRRTSRPSTLWRKGRAADDWEEVQAALPKVELPQVRRSRCPDRAGRRRRWRRCRAAAPSAAVVSRLRGRRRHWRDADGGGGGGKEPGASSVGSRDEAARSRGGHRAARLEGWRRRGEVRRAAGGDGGGQGGNAAGAGGGQGRDPLAAGRRPAARYRGRRDGGGAARARGCAG